jgi:hypothetical protein
MWACRILDRVAVVLNLSLKDAHLDPHTCLDRLGESRRHDEAAILEDNAVVSALDIARRGPPTEIRLHKLMESLR